MSWQNSVRPIAEREQECIRKKNTRYNTNDKTKITDNTDKLHCCNKTSLVAWWSELLTAKHEAPGSIPSSAVGNFTLQGKSPSWNPKGLSRPVKGLLYPYKNRCHKYDHYYLTPSKTRGRAYIS
jgi:hypothetical protein